MQEQTTEIEKPQNPGSFHPNMKKKTAAETPLFLVPPINPK